MRVYAGALHMIRIIGAGAKASVREDERAQIRYAKFVLVLCKLCV